MYITVLYSSEVSGLSSVGCLALAGRHYDASGKFCTRLIGDSSAPLVKSSPECRKAALLIIAFIKAPIQRPYRVLIHQAKTRLRF